MQEKEQLPIYSSDHLYLVGFLVCSGHRIIGMSRNGARVSFEFHKTPDLLADVGGFMSGAKIPARQFSFELLKLKRTLNGGEYMKVNKLKKNESEEVCSFNSPSGS